VSRAAFTRRSGPIIDEIRAVFDRFEPPLTVRQVYYQLATVGLVPLSQQGYRRAARLLLKVRLEGIIPWTHFADRTRHAIGTAQWDGPAHFAKSVAVQYRRDMWRTQPEHVEIWLEKDALSGFFEETTRAYCVPLYPMRGYSSATFVHEGAEALNRIRKPKFIYYFGDHDPSGLDLERDLKEKLADFGAEFTFARVAITLADVKTFGLRALAAKPSDARTARYTARHGAATIELDALPPDELRKRITDCIMRHVDRDEWERLQRVETIEKGSIVNLAREWAAAAPAKPGDHR
jgi:hypothetical protein